jgi:hypothetical protein
MTWKGWKRAFGCLNKLTMKIHLANAVVVAAVALDLDRISDESLKRIKREI